MEAFVPSTTFDGPREGYDFKSGPQGLGYYKQGAGAGASGSELKQTPQVYLSTLAVPQTDVCVTAEHGLVLSTLGTTIGTSGTNGKTAMVVPELLNIQIEGLKNDVISRLKQAAADKGGNAVLGFSLTVSTAVGSGGGNLVAVAQGTAVTLQPVAVA